MNPLRISLCQQPLAWEDRHANLVHFRTALSGLKGLTDLVILPEMFTTGFTKNAEALADRLHGQTLEWMQRMAADLGASITGSFICKEPGIESEQYFNRLLWVNADGTYQHYDKRHLFSFAGEHFHYSAGRERIVVELKGWRICPLICYDLRFPVWSRNSATESYDLLIYVANWPEARSLAWKDLLAARAHENQSYVVGVNRVGVDGLGIAYSGDSRVLSPRGELLLSMPPSESGIATIEVGLQDLREFREKFRAWEDADRFELKV